MTPHMDFHFHKNVSHWRPPRGGNTLSVLLAFLALAIAALGMTACGSAGTDSVAAKATTGHDADGDIDSLGQGGRYDTDNDATLLWGPAADSKDRQAVIALIRGYYAIAVAGDGVKACTMLSLPIREQVEEQGRHSTCARFLSKLFAQRHRELVEDVAAFRITTVQLRGSRAVALTDFSPTRVLQIFVHRTHGVWQMETPLYDAAE